MTSPITTSLDADGVGWIEFDDRASKANILTSEVLVAIESAIIALSALPIRAVVVASAKERVFLAGADINFLAQLPDAVVATEVSQLGQRVFQRLADWKVPVVCAIHGAAAGGGFELALACHWRIASDALVTQVGLPESSIGTIPGWGGTVRLARLLGPEAALGHILQGRLLPVLSALELGLIDEIVPASVLRTHARTVALRFAERSLPVRPSRSIPQQKWYTDLKNRMGNELHQNPALLAAIKVVQLGARLKVVEALALEARTFGEVTAGASCKNMIYAFTLLSMARKRTLSGWFEESTPTPSAIQTVGVVGAGVMGSGIAQWCVTRGCRVVLTDSDPEALSRARKIIVDLFAEMVKRRKISDDLARQSMERMSFTTVLRDLEGCDLVIEAIVEDIAAKRAILSDISRIIKPRALLASNTSALPIEEIAAQVPNPERILGIHFFNPVSRMALVELVIARFTSSSSAMEAIAWIKALDKSPVICRSSPGFLVTRVLFFYLNEACRLWEQGVPTASIDCALRDWGWPMGPMRLIDEIGVDVAEFIFREIEHYFPRRIQAPAICGRMLEVGLKGRKNGAGSGFYIYDGCGETVNPTPAKISPGRIECASDFTRAPAQIVERLIGVMIAEAARCLDEGVVKTPEDVDFAMLSGAGFPAFKGGLLRYARSMGAFERNTAVIQKSS